METNRLSPNRENNLGYVTIETTEENDKCNIKQHGELPFLDLQGSRMRGVLTEGGLKIIWAFCMNGSSLSPRLSIFNPKAHRAITSIVKALKILSQTTNKIR